MGNRVKGNLKRKIVSALVLSLVLSSCPSFLSFAGYVWSGQDLTINIDDGYYSAGPDHANIQDRNPYNWSFIPVPTEEYETVGQWGYFINSANAVFQPYSFGYGFDVNDYYSYNSTENSLNAASATANSANRIKFFNDESVYGISSVSNVESAPIQFNNSLPYYDESAYDNNEYINPKTYIGLETVSGDGDLVVVTRNNGNRNHIYLKEVGNDESDGLQAKVPYEDGGYSNKSVVVFNVKENTEYKLFADEGTYIYYVTMLDNSTVDSWDFSTADTWGSLNETLSNQAVYVDGLILEAYESDGIVKTTDGVQLLEGSDICVPNRDGKLLAITGSNYTVANDSSGYAKISTTGTATIEKLEWKLSATVPSAVTNLTYNGQVQTGVAAGTGYTLTGNTATAAGTYTATARLSDGYIWSDGTVADKTIQWSIAEAPTQSGTGTQTGGQSQSGSSTQDSSQSQKPVSKISLSKTKVSVKVGASVKVTATLKNDTIKSVKSAKTSIAKVSFKGKKITIKGVKAGSTTITVKTKSGLSKKIKVTVTPTTTKLTVSKTSVTLQKKGKKVTVKATATPNKSKTGESITVSSSNKKVATVSINQKTGKITIKAVKKGSCKITVKAGNKKKIIKVKVKK